MENVVNAVAHIKPVKKSALIVIYRFITRFRNAFTLPYYRQGAVDVIDKALLTFFMSHLKFSRIIEHLDMENYPCRSIYD